MTDLDEFLQKHGAEFSKILRNPSFNAGMILLTLRVMEGVKNLSDDEITRNSLVILSDIRGRLRHETEILSLPTPPEELDVNEVQEEYVDQITENFQESQRTGEPPSPPKPKPRKKK